MFFAALQEGRRTVAFFVAPKQGEVLFGVHRFEAIARNTAAPRDILTARLRCLVGAGVLEKVRHTERPPRHEYRLTPADEELRPVLLMLPRWGDRHLRNVPPTVAREDGITRAQKGSPGSRTPAQRYAKTPSADLPPVAPKPQAAGPVRLYAGTGECGRTVERRGCPFLDGPALVTPRRPPG